MSEEINHERRRFLGTAAMTIAAAEFVMIGSANAQSSSINPADATTLKPGAITSFGSLKQNAHTESSRASVTICLKKPRLRLPKLSSKSLVIDRR